MIWSEFAQYIDDDMEILFRIRVKKAIKNLQIKELINIPIYISYQTRSSDFKKCNLIIFEGSVIDKGLIIPGYLNVISYETHDSEFIDSQLGLYYVISNTNYKINTFNCMVAVILVFQMAIVKNINCELLITNLFDSEIDVFKKYTVYKDINKFIQGSITTRVKKQYNITVFKNNSRYFVDMDEPNLSIISDIVKDVYADRFKLQFTEELIIDCKGKTKYIEVPTSTKKLTLLNAARLGAAYNKVEELIIKPYKKPFLYDIMRLFPHLVRADIPLANQYTINIDLSDSYSENKMKLDELISIRERLDKKIEEYKLI